MLELISSLAERGLTVKVDAYKNGTRGVRYNIIVTNESKFGVPASFPTFSFSVGAWDVETLKARIADNIKVVEPIIALMEVTPSSNQGAGEKKVTTGNPYWDWE